jgi:phenylacetate-CoA ligase
MSDCVFVEFFECPGLESNNLKEIVVTDLHSFSFPIIRYRLGDLVKLSEKPCSCGLPFPTFEKVVGRSSEIFEIDGKKHHSLLFYYIVKSLGKNCDLVQFRVVQKSKRGFCYQLCGIEKNIFLEKEIIAKTKQELGNEINVTFEYPDQMPREASGKLRDFVPYK